MTEYYNINFGDFDLDVVISLDDIKTGTNKKKLIRDELRYSLKIYHYTISTNGYTPNDIKDIYGVDPINDSWDHVISTVWDCDKPKYTAKSIRKLPSCEGCRFDAPGQKDHMYVGGCLYDPEGPYF
jgi:hypothetical protein